MWEAERTSQIATEMRRYSMSALGISEIHCIQDRQQRLNMEEMLLYSGHEAKNAPHTQRVALMLSKASRNVLVG
ncbi:unnamed protein product [Schistosoma margrebowiei]|uniref:Uncharacterized protein n=1 Tax=Schistosoma margrebowiei TaxID=48269 RepID=A0A183N9E1_9TREM|nr:unnamed protein product [Schistosoma margrebowiei]